MPNALAFGYSRLCSPIDLPSESHHPGEDNHLLLDTRLPCPLQKQSFPPLASMTKRCHANIGRCARQLMKPMVMPKSLGTLQKP